MTWPDHYQWPRHDLHVFLCIHYCQNIWKCEKVQIPPVVDAAVLQFQERWQPDLSASFFFFCCNAISRIISSWSKKDMYQDKILRFVRMATLLVTLSILTLFFWPSCCLLCLIRSRRSRVSSCEFARLLIVVSGIGRFTWTCKKWVVNESSWMTMQGKLTSWSKLTQDCLRESLQGHWSSIQGINSSPAFVKKMHCMEFVCYNKCCACKKFSSKWI